MKVAADIGKKEKDDEYHDEHHDDYKKEYANVRKYNFCCHLFHSLLLYQTLFLPLLLLHYFTKSALTAFAISFCNYFRNIKSLLVDSDKFFIVLSHNLNCKFIYQIVF